MVDSNPVRVDTETLSGISVGLGVGLGVGVGFGLGFGLGVGAGLGLGLGLGAGVGSGDGAIAWWVGGFVGVAVVGLVAVGAVERLVGPVDGADLVGAFWFVVWFAVGFTVAPARGESGATADGDAAAGGENRAGGENSAGGVDRSAGIAEVGVPVGAASPPGRTAESVDAVDGSGDEPGACPCAPLVPAVTVADRRS